MVTEVEFRDWSLNLIVFQIKDNGLRKVSL